jgi:hypothetical protein
MDAVTLPQQHFDEAEAIRDARAAAEADRKRT